LAIQHQKRDAKVWASDASTDALDVARANAARLGLLIQFLHGSWLAPLLAAKSDTVSTSDPIEPSCAHPTFDLIVSNPPYLAEGDPHLPALTHEPIGALTSGPDGLRDIRQIVQQSPACLKAGGWLLLEHGYVQAGMVTEILHAGGFTHIQSRKDLAGIERCTGGQWLPMASGG
jgi:release factor glutamine methyltransferase